MKISHFRTIQSKKAHSSIVNSNNSHSNKGLSPTQTDIEVLENIFKILFFLYLFKKNWEM